MIVWGSAKQLTFRTMRTTERYQPDWPATVIHECRGGVLLTDGDAAKGTDTP